VILIATGLVALVDSNPEDCTSPFRLEGTTLTISTISSICDEIDNTAELDEVVTVGRVLGEVTLI
jgi:hypothetical protein